MKRREFLRSVGAAGLVPLLPGQMIAGGGAISEALYAKAVHYTRMWGTTVPEMYTSALGLNLDQANNLFGKLVQDRVVAMPNANGFAKAVAPYYDASVAARAAAERANLSPIEDVSDVAARADRPIVDQVRSSVRQDPVCVEEQPDALVDFDTEERDQNSDEEPDESRSAQHEA